MAAAAADSDLVENKRRLRRKRVSHCEDACPCRMRVGGPVVVVVRPRGMVGSAAAVVVPVVDEEDTVCVLDECGRGLRSINNNNNINNNKNKEQGGPEIKNRRLTTSLSLDRKNKKSKRFSVTSTSSSVSMLSTMGDNEDEEEDLNNNNNNYKRNSREEDQQNRRNEAKEEVLVVRDSFGSASSFTKDIMRMIENNNNNASQRVNQEDYYGHSHDRESQDEDDDRKPDLNEDDNDRKSYTDEVNVTMMNRRNSDMSDKQQQPLKVAVKTPSRHIICDCACHYQDAFDAADEKSKMAAGKLKKQKSLTSPQSVHIYSIEEPKREKGQLEHDESEGQEEEDEARYLGEYDNDELAAYYAETDEVEQKRRSVL